MYKKGVVMIILIFSGKSLELGREFIGIDINYADKNIPKKCFNSTEKSPGNACMKNSVGQCVKMERQFVKRKFFILTDIVTNKPRRERNSRTLQNLK